MKKENSALKSRIEKLEEAVKLADWFADHIMGKQKRVDWGKSFDVDWGKVNVTFIKIKEALKADEEAGE